MPGADGIPGAGSTSAAAGAGSLAGTAAAAAGSGWVASAAAPSSTVGTSIVCPAITWVSSETPL